MAQEFKLTTIDNPYDPFTNFDDWFQFDTQKGYDSSSRLMRIANITDEMSSVEVQNELERAIDEIIKYDFTDTYKKVSRNITDNASNSIQTQGGIAGGS